MRSFLFPLVLLLTACAPEPESKTPGKERPAAEDTATTCTLVVYRDNDQDGYGDSADSMADVCEAPEGYTPDGTDCDDRDAAINPGASETCDNVDNNCNTVVDENPSNAWYADDDGDGYGNAAYMITSCDVLHGYVANATDCDDADATIHPRADEHCDSVDEDCDGDVDDNAVDAWAWYPDADGDGNSTADDDVEPIMACLEDKPGAGYNSDHSDCDDTDPTVGPDAPELCDGWDNNCNAYVDDNAIDAPIWYPDNDEDGYGDPYGWGGAPIQSCEQPVVTYVDDNTDCDDWNAEAFPGGEEVCDWADNDCDGFMDGDDPEGVAGGSTWYKDHDWDGYGGEEVIGDDLCEYDALVASLAWNVSPTGDDCYDDGRDPNAYYVNPGTDDDNDGFNYCDDCDDRNWRVYPGATEVANGYDDDCDSSNDE